jgi:hypothetical protein
MENEQECITARNPYNHCCGDILDICNLQDLLTPPISPLYHIPIPIQLPLLEPA